MPKTVEVDISLMNLCINLLIQKFLKNTMKLTRKIVGCLAASEKNLPIIVPGWEDSTLGNIFASYCIKGELNGEYNEIRN